MEAALGLDRSDPPDPRLLLAAIVQSSEDAIVSKDLTGRVTSWNQGAARIFGYTAEEMIGQSITLLIPPGHENEEPSILTRIRAGERIEHFQTRRRHKDGHLIDISLTISPVRNEAGDIIGASKIARDITQDLAGRAAIEEAAALRGAVAEAESFSYMVSHDLRTPLRAIDGFSRRLLKHADRLDPEDRESLDYVVGAVHKMSATIEGLLTLSRVSRLPLQRRDLDVSAACKDVLADLRAGSDRHVEAIVPPGLRAYADPDLLHVILCNLLGNAWKFTRQQPAALIEVGCEGPPDRPAHYFVRDNGIGFAPEQAAQLFAAFHRLNPLSEFEGSGIGLATVRRAVERHGGRAWAEGRPGEGATVSFTLGM